jgi:hypothetical protein
MSGGAAAALHKAPGQGVNRAYRQSRPIIICQVSIMSNLLLEIVNQLSYEAGDVNLRVFAPGQPKLDPGSEKVAFACPGPSNNEDPNGYQKRNRFGVRVSIRDPLGIGERLESFS